MHKIPEEDAKGEVDELAGALVETAYTGEQIEQANAEEQRLGIDGDCAFLGSAKL